MPFDLSKLKASAGKLAAGFTTGQKVVTGLAVLAVLVAGFAFTSWASRPSYSPLFTGLEAADAAAITEKLDGAGVSYQLADGGRSVLVPRKDVYQLRLDMSAAGLPEGASSGYALLDKQGITASEFRQRVDFQRALEGELTKTVTAIDGVDAANVHLVIPEDDLFADDDRHPSASVLVKTGAGKRLAPGQVQAIVHLVSSSVEGLQAEHVTVADARGNVLSAPGDAGIDAAGGDARSQQVASFEADVARSVQELLQPVTGPDGAVVRVKAELDFDQRSTRTERYEPVENAQPLTEATSRETFNGTGTPVGGVLGPDAVPLAPGAGQSTYEKEQAQRANAVNKVTEDVKAAPGRVRRMSVAVLIDGAAKGAEADAVRELVAAATLFDAERGDSIEVQSLAFDRTAAEQAEKELAEGEAAARKAETMQTVRTLAVLAVIVVAVLLVWRSSRRQRREALELPAGLALATGDTAVIELEADDGLELSSGREPATALEPAAGRRVEVQREIADLVDRQPDEVAQLLRGWLADRRA
ncbi:MAG: flagellar M-ring protein FliF [Actinomycetota bacterium]|nr:flagellar M-ring protein FliF [Actinomycetota bacterium]